MSREKEEISTAARKAASVLSKTIVDRVAVMAARMGMEPPDLMKRAGLHGKYWDSSLKPGSVPGGIALLALAKAMGVSVDWLLGRTDDPTFTPGGIANTQLVSEAKEAYTTAVELRVELRPGLKPGDEVKGKIVQVADEGSTP